MRRIAADSGPDHADVAVRFEQLDKTVRQPGQRSRLVKDPLQYCAEVQFAQQRLGRFGQRPQQFVFADDLFLRMVPLANVDANAGDMGPVVDHQPHRRQIDREMRAVLAIKIGFGFRKALSHRRFKPLDNQVDICAAKICQTMHPADFCVRIAGHLVETPVPLHDVALLVKQVDDAGDAVEHGVPDRFFPAEPLHYFFHQRVIGIHGRSPSARNRLVGLRQAGYAFRLSTLIFITTLRTGAGSSNAQLGRWTSHGNSTANMPAFSPSSTSSCNPA